MDVKSVGIDVESAYGSEISSTLIMSKEQFSLEEPPSKTEMCYQWIKYRVRHYMILEALLFIILIVLLSNSYHISSQNEKTYELISNFQTQINNIEKRIGLNNYLKNNHLREQVENIYGKNNTFDDLVAEIIIDLDTKPTKVKEIIQKEEISKSIDNTPTEQNAVEKLIDIKTKPIEMKGTIQKGIPSKSTENITNEKKTLERIHSNFTDENEHSNISTNCSIPQLNAASYMMGARVDYRRSSSSDATPFFGFDQSGYVLLERDELPSNKAWCSDEKEPILTVWLTNYIKPTAVSYQHTKWNETVPNGAPKIYDLVACLDYLCEDTVPLVSNCEYKEDGKQEQICPIPTNQNISSIDKVQLRFRENHGNMTKTCAYLVRVYGELSDRPEKKEDPTENEKTCSKLTWNYHNRPFMYTMMSKDCETLYSKRCCIECPECCRDCEMKDFNFEVIFICIFIVFLFFLFFILPCIATYFEEKRKAELRKKYSLNNVNRSI